MATVQDLAVRITADTRDAERNIQRFKSVVSDSFKVVQGVAAAGAVGFTAFAAATDQIISKSIQFAKEGGRISDLSKTFDQLAASAGKVSGVFLSELRTATEGVISNTELMAAANKALSLDLEASGASFVQLAEQSKRLADATGQDAAQSLDTLTQALATGRTMSLNALGVSVDLTNAEEKFARSVGKSAEDLTEREKVLARQRATIESVQRAVEKLGDIEDTAGDSAEKLATAFKNGQEQFAQSVASSDNLKQAFEQLAAVINTIDFAKLGGELAELVGDFVRGASVIIENVNLLLDSFGQFEKQIIGRDLFNVAAQKTREGLFNILRTQEEALLKYQIQKEQFEKEAAAIRKTLSDPIGAAKLVSTEGLTGLTKIQEILKDREQQIGRLGAQIQGTEKIISAADERLENWGDTFEKVGKQAESHPIVSDKQLEKIKDLKLELSDLVRTLDTDIFKDGINLAIETQNAEQFDKLTASLETATFSGFREGYQKFIDAGLLTDDSATRLAQLQVDRVTEDYREQFISKAEDANTKAADDLKRKLEDSANFFSDVFYDAFTGKAFDLKNALDKLLSGVLGGALGSVFPGAGQFGNLQGLGQTIGASLLGNTLGPSLGNLLGSSGAASTGIPAGAIGQNADGTFILSSGASTSGSILGAASSTGAAAAVAATAAVAVDSALKILKGKKISDVSAAILALPTFGASLLVNPLTEAFGSGKSGDQQQRDAIRKQLQDSGFLDSNFSFSLLGSGGRGNLGAERFQGTKLSDALGPGVDPRALGLTSGISQIITGGDDKLSQDFNNMLANITSGFSDATDASQNFNEILANVMGVMDQLGLTVDGTKDQLKNMFLDGTVSLQEFHDGLQGLNLVAQENLVGEGSISDALQILANNFDNPKNQLAALELLMNEAKEVGISDISDLGAHIETTLGVTAAATFQKFENAGINSFEDLQNASADQIFLIISGLYDLKDQFYDTFDISSSADSFERNSSRVQSALGKTKSAAASAAEAQKKYNEQLRAGVSAQNNGGDDNKALNKTRR